MSFFLKTLDRLLENGILYHSFGMRCEPDHICLILVFISSEVFRLRFGLQVAHERFL
jgi:hypothetical protein